MRKEKGIAVLLALILALTIPAGGMAAPVTGAVETELAAGRKASLLLGALNIYEAKEGEDPTAAISRADFTALVVSMLRMQKLADSYQNSVMFGDVDAAFEKGGYINLAAELGLVDGDEYRLFLPDAPVTGYQAAKILVCALGYQLIAEESGGWVDGYRRTASSLGLFDNAGAGQEQNLTREDAFIMVYNALHAANAVPGDRLSNIAVSRNTGKSLLEEYYGVARIEGILSANRFTSLTEAKTENANYITVGEQRLLSYAEADGDLLGKNVVCYYQTEKEEAVLIFEKQNRELIIASKDLIGYNGGSYQYYASNGSRQTARLTSDYDLIYNLSASATGYSDDKYMPKSGYIRLVDNDRDGLYEVLFIYDFTNRVVDSVSAENQTLTFLSDSGGQGLLDLSDESCQIRSFDNAVLTLADVKANAAVSILISDQTPGNRLYTLYVADTGISGTVSALDGESVTISDGAETKQYSLDEKPGDAYGLKALQAGKTGEFFINYMGELFAYKEESSNSKVIGLLIKTAMEGDTMYARLLNGAGELLELACADTFRLSGPFGNDPAVRESMRIRNHEDAYKRITARFNGNLIQEAVMYAVNADNKIASVDFAVEHNSALENGDPNLEGDGFHYILKDFTSMVYFYNPRAFITKTPRGLDQTLLTAAGIQWFTVPETYGNLPDEQVFSAAATGLTNDKTAVVKLYSTTGSLPIADVGLVQADSSTVDGTTESYGVSEKATTIYNETPAIELTLVSGGQEKSYYAEDSDEIRDLEPGDVIQMSTDVTGKIIKCSKVLDFHKEDGRPYLSVEGSSDGNFWDSSGVASSVSPGTISRFMFGTAYRMFDSKLFLVKPNELETAKTASEAIDLSAFTNIMVFDCRTRKWKKGSRDDVNSYYNAGDEASMLFLRMNYSNARELFVYNP